MFASAPDVKSDIGDRPPPQVTDWLLMLLLL